MADVTSGLLSVNTTTRFQLTAERFPVGESHDVSEDDDWTKNGISSSSSEAEDRSVPCDDLIEEKRSKILKFIKSLPYNRQLVGRSINKSIYYSLLFDRQLWHHCTV